MGVEEARAEHEGGSVSKGPEGGDEGPWGPIEEGPGGWGEVGPVPEGVPVAGAGKVTSGSALQIGSYFGASLCTVDVDRDGNTDLVLIGAPHYYKPTQGGQVSVCPLPQGVSV